MTQKAQIHYDLMSRAFHWVTAIVVTVAFILGPEHFGRMMRTGVDPATHSDIVWHETLGALVFVLTLLRLLWVALRPGAPQFAMSKPMRVASKLGHLALWVLMLALPMTAILALGTEAYPLTLLGGLRVNQMLWVASLPIAGLADWGDVHGFFGDALIWLAGLHAVAAVYHHIVLKDGVLAAMLPVLRRR